MPREVGDDQHLIAQRRNKQQIDLREDSSHLQSDFAAQSVRLNKVDRRQEPSLPEQVRPRVRNLRLQFAQSSD